MKITDKIDNKMLILTTNILLKYSLPAAMKPDVSKSVVTAMRYTIDDKHLIKWI